MLFQTVAVWAAIAYDVVYLDSTFIEFFIVGGIAQAAIAIWWLRFFKRRIYGRVPAMS